MSRSVADIAAGDEEDELLTHMTKLSLGDTDTDTGEESIFWQRLAEDISATLSGNVNLVNWFYWQDCMCPRQFVDEQDEEAYLALLRSREFTIFFDHYLLNTIMRDSEVARRRLHHVRRIQLENNVFSAWTHCELSAGMRAFHVLMQDVCGENRGESRHRENLRINNLHHLRATWLNRYCSGK